MTKLTTAALFFLAAGIFTSVSILSAYQVLFVIPLVYYTYMAISDKSVKLPVSAWFLLAFTLVALLSLVINFELIPKPSKNFGKLKYFLFGVGGIFVFRVWLIEATDKTKRLLVNVFLASIIIAALYSVYQFVSGMPRVKGLTDTMRYGYGSAMILLTLLSALFHREKIKNWFDARLGLIAFIFGFIGMYLTYTRGGLLGFLSGLPFVFYFYKPKMGITLGAGVILVIGILGGFYLFGSGESSSRYLTSKDNSSDNIRRSQWKAAVIAFQERPILGWGLSNFHSQLNRIKMDYDLEAKEYNDAHAHNIFLEVAAGTGIIGLLIFLGWLISWSIEVFQADQMITALIIPFGSAFVISSLFEVTFDANNASMIFFLYALSVTGRSKKV